MSRKQVWDEWKWTAAALAVCVAAFLLTTRAWQVGYDAKALALLGCHVVRLPLLLLAWWTAVASCKAAVRKEASSAAGVTPLDVAGLCVSFTACLGCYPVWPVVLLLASLLLVAFSQKDAVGPSGGRSVVLRVGVACLLFTLTWYLCATTTRQALRGLGERVEEKVGADRLLAWATEVLGARKPGGQPPNLAPAEIPDFVDDLLGSFQGVRGVTVEEGNLRCVTLYTGGSAYHFRMRVCPSRAGEQGTSSWFGEVVELEWQPGIYLGTGGK